jgi:hypothetical protein
MIRGWYLALVAGLVVSSAAQAQTACRFRWQPGQVLTYRVEQVMTESGVIEGSSFETITKCKNVKHWQVLAVDAVGVATVQMSLASLRLETTAPNGETLVFDSADPEKSNPQMKEQLSRYVGQPLALLRIDAQGRVVEVKESKHGPASRFESEPPFAVVLPASAFQPGQGWERSYNVTLEPPKGTGEKYPATQKYVCKSMSGATATIAITTALKSLPAAVADQVPLLQMQPEGEVVFDTQAGYMKSARMQVDKELAGQQGEGSSYHFKSTYTEEYAGAR